MTLKEAQRWVIRIVHWKMLFASWQLGTRVADDPECQAVKDMRELLIIVRIENSALARVLVEKGIITEEQFSIKVGEEAKFLDEAYSKRFPGVSSTDDGLSFNGPVLQEHGTMKGWKP